MLPNAKEINIAWLNTAFSSGFRAVEIPFFVAFISQSLNVEREISLFGVVLSVIVASSGILLSLTTPGSCGENPKGMKRLGVSFTTLSILVSIALTFILYLTNDSFFDGEDFSIIVVILILSLLSISLRRIYQGALIYINKSWVILFSALARVLLSILMCTLLPEELASGMTALYVIILAAILDTMMNISLYYICRRKIKVQYKDTPYRESSFYFSISMTSIVYTAQNYLIILILTVIHKGHDIKNWVILYSFISIFSGIYLDIENIVARFRLSLINIFESLSLPFCVGFVLFFTLWILPSGRNLYFIRFQGVTDISLILGTQWLVIASIITFLIKQFFKGFLLYNNEAPFLRRSSYMNIFGIIASGIILYFLKASILLITAGITYLVSLLFEFTYLIYGYKKIRRLDLHQISGHRR